MRLLTLLACLLSMLVASFGQNSPLPTPPWPITDKGHSQAMVWETKEAQARKARECMIGRYKEYKDMWLEVVSGRQDYSVAEQYEFFRIMALLDKRPCELVGLTRRFY